MTYKTILVHLDGAPRSSECLAFGFGIAAQFGAHLIGLYAPGVPRLPSYALAEAGEAVREIVGRRHSESLAAAQKQVRDAAARRGDASAEWRAAGGDAGSAVRLSARYADLVVAAQPEPEDDGWSRALADEMLLSAGRPLLFLPYAGQFTNAGKRVLVAWDGGREAARAVSDALPFLRNAESVEVAVFDPQRGGDRHGQQPGADIALFLARHGVKVTVHQQSGAGYDVGSQILSRAADIAGDLIVMGGYGHSRARELLLGGATRTVLETMTVPVLMSH